MSKPHLIIIDDQTDVLSTLRNDLESFREKFVLDDCESAEEAEELIEELDATGESIAVIFSDHVMPEKNGIDFLSELSRDDRFKGVYKVLITGQASHSDTIDAINNASINYYISKPWAKNELELVCKKMITNWILDHEMDHQDFGDLIDSEILLNRSKGSSFYSE